MQDTVHMTSLQLNRFQTSDFSCCLAGVSNRLNHPDTASTYAGFTHGFVADQGHEMPPYGSRLSQSTLADMVYEVPCLLEILDAKSRASLSGCSKYLQQLIHSVTTTITVNDISDVECLVKGDCPAWL